MKLLKKATYPLEKCYSLANLPIEGKNHIIVAAEKKDRCLLFSLSGELEDIIWDEPGGTMSLVPIPNCSAAFLASQKMYSPNDSTEAKIVLVQKLDSGQWSVKTFVNIPFVHRFDILETDTGLYLFVATIKSAHAYKEDWSSPGQVLTCKLPDDILNNPCPPLIVLKEGLLKNHGYCRRPFLFGKVGVTSSENGVFSFTPPHSQCESWQIEQFCANPISDIAFTDFDNDGQEEMVVFSPFHGDTLAIYKKNKNKYVPVYTHPKKLEFIHAIWAGTLYGQNFAIVGHRKGASRDLLGISFKKGAYHIEVLEKDAGSTNILHYKNAEKEWLVSANREKNEIAFYEIEDFRE